METMEKIRELHPAYAPAPEYRDAFVRSGFVAFTNQIAGSGKDSLKDETALLCGALSCPSYTDRPWRPSDGPELGNTSYVYLTHEEMLEEIEAGTFIEYEPLRDYSYATPGREIVSIVNQGKRVFKDLEPNGLRTLRGVMGNDGLIRAVYPLPDLSLLDDGRTRWEHMLTDRDYKGHKLEDVLGGACGEGAASDLVKRLAAAAGQRDQIERMGLQDDPETLFVVNTFGELKKTAYQAARFVNHGRGISHASCPIRGEVVSYLGKVRDIAEEALAKAA